MSSLGGIFNLACEWLYFFQRKCDQYWPTEGDNVYGLMNVKLLSESVTAHYTLRKFMLKYVKDARISVRKVWIAWPFAI